MDKNLLVEIFVPTTGERGLIGTGYPVAKDRILTARHVLFPDDRDRQRPIEVRWYHQQGAAREWIATDDAIAWEGGRDCDAAVLACTFPEGVVEWGLPSAERPQDQWKWESEGFAEAGKRDDQTRRPVGMIGEVFSAADTAPEFELGAKYAVELPEGWRGASGSPVFVMGKIVGVVVTCLPGFNAQKLRAVPVWRLLADQAFRSAIGFDERAERLEQVRRAIAAHLEKAPRAMEALAAEAGVHDHTGKAGVWAADLSHKLLDIPMAHVIQRSNRAHLRLCQNGADEGDVVAIDEVARELLPVLFDHAIIAGLRSKIGGQRGALVSFPAATRTSTEIIMAGVDKRAALFRPAAHSVDFPEGEFALPVPPECGIDPTCSEFEKAWHDQLIEMFVPSEFRQRFRGREETLREIAAQELASRADPADGDPTTYYFVFDPPRAGADSTEWRAALARLKRQYSAVVFVELLADDELVLAELQSLRPLRDLLDRGHRRSRNA